MSSLQYKDISSLVRISESKYNEGTVNVSEYVDWSLKDNISRIEAYLNSKHISGPNDQWGREKPFFNIVTAAANIWFRATDIDRKYIKIKANKQSQYLMAFLGNIHLQNWIEQNDFEMFLNDWGRTLSRYGSAVCKFIEKNGNLYPMVIPWNRLIVDQIQFEHLPVIEKLYYSPNELLEKAEEGTYDKEMVRKLLDVRKYREGLYNATRKDTKSDFIEVYEVHGKLPLAYLNYEDTYLATEEEEKTYVQQMHVISFMARKDSPAYDNYTLYKGREAKNPYVITHLIKEEGRIQAIGAVEHLFDAQWMVNHSQKLIKDQLELASKLIFQTADSGFVGRNILTNVDNGAVMIHQQNQPLEVITNKPNIQAMEAFGAQWERIAKEISATPDAYRGQQTPGAGTKGYRQAALLVQQSETLFNLMTKNKATQLKSMIRTFVIPHLKRKMNSAEEISATLEDYQIKQIDEAYVPIEAARLVNEHIEKQTMAGKPTATPNMADIQNQVRSGLSRLGNQRFITPSEVKTKKWSEVLKNFEWEVDVKILDEPTDTQKSLQILSQVLKTISQDPNVLRDPNAKLLFGRILEASGAVSPIELTSSQEQLQAPQIPQQQIPQQPQQNLQAMVGSPTM